MNGRRILPAFVVAVTLGVGIVIGTLVSHGVRAARSANALAADATPLPAPSPAELSNSFSRVADMVEPAVVNINTETVVRVGRRRFHGQEDSPFGDFFDRFFQGDPDSPFGGGEFRQPSLGSGVILDKNGYILTNYHVLMQSGENKPVDRIRVRLHGEDDGGRGHEAKVIGRDRETDLAVIKIETNKPLPYAQFGDSDSIRVGDWVLAIGSPFGLDSTVTAGILSAKGRDIEGGAQGQFKRYLQTDAAINPGNSGGPLVNLAGQVIGINTAIATNRGTYDGVGFAVPSNTARKIYNQLITSGSVQRGAIGVSFQNVNNPAVLRSFGADHGVVVNSVEAGSPAEKAGLKRGDVITSVNGRPIKEGDQLVGIVSETEIGKKLKVEVLRDRKPMSFDVEVGDRNKTFSRLRGTPDDAEEEGGGEAAGGLFGISVRNLTSEQASDVAEKLNLSGAQGVLVTEVKGDGFAADVGIVRGDIILSINHQPVRSANDVATIQGKLKSGDDVLFFVARRTQRTFTTIYLADRLP
ncbi:MAG: Do family serine endopeptidase [Acidobacteria bacterium]|nr:Do family serine endopeptidase [Acidobacteriota bacterium]